MLGSHNQPGHLDLRVSPGNNADPTETHEPQHSHIWHRKLIRHVRVLSLSALSVGSTVSLLTLN